MLRLKPAAVRSGWEISRSRAAAPTRMEPSSSTLTTLGVRYSPAALGMSSLLPPRHTAARLFVVPRSIPMMAMACTLLPDRPGSCVLSPNYSLPSNKNQ